MRWICPRCGVSLSLALSQCPYCPPAESAPQPVEARPAAAEPPKAEESPYLRGARFAVGFLLAVVTILLLLALLLEWLAAHPEWQPWLGAPGG